MMIETPYSQEAEEAVLGSVLINPNSFYTLRGIIGHDDFYFLRHSYIWQAMERLHDRGDAIDNITITKELDGMKQLDNIGGPAFITRLITATPTSVHAEVYARLVERTSKRRKLMIAADEIKALALDEQLTIDEVMQQSTGRIFNATASKSNKRLTWYERVKRNDERKLKMLESPDKTMGIPTGHKAIDRHTLGLRAGALTYVGARPGVGKTVLLGQWAFYAASRGHKVGYWSGEMSGDEMIDRIVTNHSNLPNTIIRSMNFVNDSQRLRWSESQAYVSQLPIEFWDGETHEGAMTPSRLLMSILETQARGGLDVMFVDYIDLMNSDNRQDSKPYEVKSSVSKALKQIAMRCQIPVIVAVQLNRAVEQRQDKRPQLFDMRDSGSLEQDGDIVYGLYRDELYNEDPETEGEIEINMLKNRHGETRCFYGFFNGSTSTITEADLRRVSLT